MAGVTLIYPGRGGEAGSRVLNGVTEEHAEANPMEVRRTWNGRLIPLDIGVRPRLSITLSNDGDRVWSPRVDRLQPGERLDLVSSVWMTVSIPATEGMAELPFDPAARPTPLPLRPDVVASPAMVASYVHLRDLDGRDTEFHQSGRAIIPINRFGQPRVVHFRPLINCRILACQFAGETTGRGCAWSLDLVEI